MRTARPYRPIFVVLCLSLIGSAACQRAQAQSSSTDPVPPELASRLRAIYGTNEFQEKVFGFFQWLPDSSGFINFEPSTNSDGSDLVRYASATGKREILVPSSQLIPPNGTKPLEIEDYAPSTDGTRVLIQTNTHDAGNMELADYWLLDLNSKSLKDLVNGVETLPIDDILSPDGQNLVFVRAHNLYVESILDSKVITLTTDGIPDSIGNGVSDAGDSAVIWSPDGKQIAYVQSDCREVGLFPLLNNTEAAYPKPRFSRFPQVGTPIPALRVGVVAVTGGATHWLAIPDQPGGFYLRSLNWAGNSDELSVEQLSRSRDARDILLINVRTDGVKRIYHEEDHAWVDKNENAGIKWIGGGQAFVLLSERDGWRHAYVISRDGSKQTLLTPGNFDVIHRDKIDERGGWLYYDASPENATECYLYRARLDGSGHAERVAPQSQLPGTNYYSFSPDGRRAIHNYSTFDSPSISDLIDVAGQRRVLLLEDNSGLVAKMKAWGSRSAEFFKVDIGDGIVLDAYMLKPRDFDAAKKYPVFVHVYGELAAQTVLNSWWAPHAVFHRAIADAGYLVVSFDNRGTPAPKGAAWRRASFGSLGPLSTEEQSAALREFGRTHPYADLSRVGIWGWSAGGTNTLNALFRKPDQYQVGIAVAPKPEPELYNAWFQEIFMRTPKENPDGYKRAAPLNYAEGLKGNLLIIQGTGDSNTHLQITEKLVNRLVQLGKQFDYFTYPNRNHRINEGAGTSLHLRMLIARYLIEHLPPGGR